MSETRQHLLEIRQELEALHIDGHIADSPELYLQTTLMERCLNRALQNLPEFTVGDKG